MERTNRIHRVGTITTGITLVAFGILFLLKIFLGVLDYVTIVNLWPLIIVGLGVELLLSTVKCENFVYDKASMFILVLMTFFAMGMAAVSMMFAAVGHY